MWQELAGWRRYISSRDSKGGGWEPGPPQPQQGASFAGGASRLHQQLQLGRTLATWEVQEVDNEQKRH